MIFICSKRRSDLSLQVKYWVLVYKKKTRSKISFSLFLSILIVWSLRALKPHRLNHAITLCKLCIRIFSDILKEKISQFCWIDILSKGYVYKGSDSFFDRKAEDLRYLLIVEDSKRRYLWILVECILYLYAILCDVYVCKRGCIILLHDIDSREEKCDYRHHIESLYYAINDQKKHHYKGYDIPALWTFISRCELPVIHKKLTSSSTSQERDELRHDEPRWHRKDKSKDGSIHSLFCLIDSSTISRDATRELHAYRMIDKRHDTYCTSNHEKILYSWSDHHRDILHRYISCT